VAEVPVIRDFQAWRATEPEDFAGTFQYMQALHGEIEWINPGYDPEAFDAAKIDFTPPKPRRKR
jgi:hypothetical protein